MKDYNFLLVFSFLTVFRYNWYDYSQGITAHNVLTFENLPFCNGASYPKQESLKKRLLSLKEKLGVARMTANFNSTRVIPTRSRTGRVAFASSVFGIDGSCTPAVKSWSYQAAVSLRNRLAPELTESYKSRVSTTVGKDEDLTKCFNFVMELPKKPRIPLRDFSSTPTKKYRNRSNREASKHNGLTRSISLPDVIINKMSLSKRSNEKRSTSGHREQERECCSRASTGETLRNCHPPSIKKQKTLLLNKSVWKPESSVLDDEEIESDFNQEEVFEGKDTFRVYHLRNASLGIRKIDVKLPSL